MGYVCDYLKYSVWNGIEYPDNKLSNSNRRVFRIVCVRRVELSVLDEVSNVEVPIVLWIFLDRGLCAMASVYFITCLVYSLSTQKN